ncbi:hypothetical protein ACF0H5_010254 [Mactra antiquata]
MDSKFVICWGIVSLIVLVTHQSKGDNEAEPKCFSRFDYDYKMLQKLVSLEQTIQNLKDSLADSKKRIEELSRENEQTTQNLKDSLAETINKIQELSRKNVDYGSVYIRWGRNECQDKAEVIYKGFTAGKKHNDKGSGSNTVCLPEDPSWLNYSTSDYPRGTVYGTEIDVEEPNGIFENKVNNQDIPCVACHIKKGSVIMIPGRGHCYTGWNLEYAGYLMAEFHGHPGPHNHVCVDHHPDFIQGGGGNANEHILYLTISKCGSLPCPPYANDKELACVVCSK